MENIVHTLVYGYKYVYNNQIYKNFMEDFDLTIYVNHFHDKMRKKDLKQAVLECLDKYNIMEKEEYYIKNFLENKKIYKKKNKIFLNKENNYPIVFS